MDNLFELHRQVADGLAAALADKGVVDGRSLASSRAPTENQDAYADYIQARTFLERLDVPGNIDRAIGLFQSAIRRDDRFARAYAGLGEAYWAKYNETRDPSWTVKAQAADVDALRLDPAQPEVRMALALMYRQLGRADDAVAELQRVLSAHPENDSAHALLATIHTDRSEWDAAVAEARQAIALRPNFWSHHAALGDALYYAGRVDEAIAAYSRLVELQPDSQKSFQRLGTALQAAGRLDEALQNYKKAEAIRPNPGTYSNLGTTYYWRGDMEAAVESFQHAIQLSPNKPEYYANLGDAQRRLGQTRQAADSYRKAVVLQKQQLGVKEQDAQGHAALALYMAKLNDFAAARQHMQKALAIAPEDNEVLRVSAIVHTLAGEKNDGCEALGQALAHGASPVVVAHADELLPLKGCAAYDRVATAAKAK